MNKKLKYLLILILLILVIFAVYYYFFKEEPTAATPSEDYEITSSILINEFIESPEANTSTRAVQDENGLIYYASNTPEAKTITVLNKQGTEYKRWTSESEQNIEIAGRDDSQIIFYWTDSVQPDCADLWNADNEYYSLSFGTISYSGAAKLSLFEENPELIDQARQNCLNQ